MNTAISTELGDFGVLSCIGRRPPAEQAAAARRWEAAGAETIWLGGSSVLWETEAILDATTPQVTVGTAIQSIWDCTPQVTASRFASLEEQHPGRILLGLGVSHQETTPAYHSPCEVMAQYLDALNEAGVPKERRILGALGPQMLDLARQEAAGALPYLVTVNQVSHMRERLGDALLACELGVVLETDPQRARELARQDLQIYLQLSNYRRSWRRAGFLPADLADGGSDHLVDSLYAWGSTDQIRNRIDALRAAGAHHVAVQLITGSHHTQLPDPAREQQLTALFT
ncbi:TIGR03620 family F420-dependent LLM class oxidoreductase [Streptomyces nanshensis]|uniref:Luciferase-like domain-containing protein n=1 Tax=Streptomyces nanshensis TaxID=518642 RepID=A0A1E7KZG0_9ACTN|nr:TIGR03620 family F420-dependent LLM class oxidoreductase [Streptomyces nanshensis]OEV09309.1 hypothetical protein AN218_23025 [Streptomyces nanshensis]